MNTMIYNIAELGLSKTLYDVFFALGFVSVFFFVFLSGKRLGVKPWKSVAVILTVYPTAVLWMFVMYWLENGVFGGNNIVRVFVYIPLIAYPVAKLLRIAYKDIMSMLAFGPIAVQAVSHLGCIFEGCCHGYVQDWGLYNRNTGSLHFPTQPMEALISWLIIIYLLIRSKKHNHVPDGKEYPLMLVIFGSTRFLCEFLRDNDKLWLGISSLAFHALFMFLVGLLWLVVLRRREKQI